MAEGVVFAMAPCLCCRVPFSFNPNTVPSYRVNNIREPICRGCMTRINEKRAALGLEPHPIMDDAYQPLPESEL